MDGRRPATAVSSPCSGLRPRPWWLLQCQGEGQNLTCFFTDISTSEEILIRGG
jgi:hypothetical protein